MNEVPTALLVAAGAIAALMLATWLVSLVRKDASIVDIVWGLGFVVIAWAVFATTDGKPDTPDPARRYDHDLGPAPGHPSVLAQPRQG